MTEKSDFVNIELSASGVEFAGKGGTVRVTGGHFDYTFAAGKPVRVLTSEWSRSLSTRSNAGKPILQVASAPKPNPAPAPAAPAQPQEKGN